MTCTCGHVEEAREAAWREWFRVAKHQPFLVNVETGFDAGWDARGEYDKEQIAALKSGIQNMMDAAVLGPSPDHPKQTESEVLLAIWQTGRRALRALAGQSES